MSRATEATAAALLPGPIRESICWPISDFRNIGRYLIAAELRTPRPTLPSRCFVTISAAAPVAIPAAVATAPDCQDGLAGWGAGAGGCASGGGAGSSKFPFGVLIFHCRLRRVTGSSAGGAVVGGTCSKVAFEGSKAPGSPANVAVLGSKAGSKVGSRLGASFLTTAPTGAVASAAGLVTSAAFVRPRPTVPTVSAARAAPARSATAPAPRTTPPTPLSTVERSIIVPTGSL